jgi:hypothetical protein
MSRAVALLLAACLLAGCAVKIIPPGTNGEQALQPIEQRLAQVRHLQFLAPVPVSQVSPAKVRALLAEEIDRELPPERLEAEHQLYLGLGLIGPRDDLRRTLLDLYSNEVAAFYDPVQKTMTVVSPIHKPSLALVGMTAGGQERLRDVVFSHELVHALEDQHFQLDRFEYHPGDNEDFLLAVHAVSEGSASLAGVLYLLGPAGERESAALSRLVELMESHPLNIGSGRYPEVLTAPMTFSYQAGLRFVYEVWKAQGFEGVNKLYNDPELSTELILHPEKYLARTDRPASLELPPLAELLPGYRLLDQNTLGEFGTALVLKARLGEAPAQTAAAGWAGDTYALYQNPAGDLALLWYSAWDNEAEAKEFKQALSDWSGRRNSPSEFQTTALYLADRRVLWLAGMKDVDPEAVARRFKLLD